MALRFLEGFERLGTATGSTLETELLKKWTVCGGLAWGNGTYIPTTSTGRGSGKALSMATDSRYVAITLDAQAYWVVGFAYFVPKINVPVRILAFHTGANIQCTLWRQLDGKLHLYAGDAVSHLEGGTTELYCNKWYFIEIKVKIDDSGTWEVKVNGVADFDGAGDTSNAVSPANSADTIRFYCSNSIVTGETNLFDDIYIVDGDNAFLGPGKVEALIPTSDSGAQAWTPSANADHYTLVDEAPSNLIDYVSDSVANDCDRWGYSDLAVITGNIKGIAEHTTAALDVAGSLTLKNLCVSNGTDYESSDFTVNSTTTKMFSNIRETDPNTANAWVLADLNAAAFGIKVG